MKSPLLLLLIAGAALADDAALLRCRAIADATARLACYDALPVGAAAAKGEAAAPGALLQPMAAPGALPQQPPEQFGLPRQATQVELDAIESVIPGHFDGWRPNTRIRLANGQVWQVVDGTSRILNLTDPKVTIRRGLLTAYYLEFENDNQTVRVKRLQ